MGHLACMQTWPYLTLQINCFYSICLQLDHKKLMRAVKLVLFNQIVVGGAVTLVMHQMYVWRGCSFGPELPSFHWVLFEIAIFTLVEEVGFYYSHR